ncbi:MAG: hypothetical protein H7141_06135 [Burkholderiales bacterium]|nr:hypothetical protein [Bacteroidia bacterium]
MDHFILMSSIRYPGRDKREEIENQLKNVITVINKIHKKHFITSLDMVLDYEFQGITNSLQGSLEMIFDIEECIIENNLDFKLKHVLYHNTIKTVQSKHTAYERLGFGLIDARERLQLIKKTDSRFLIATNNEKTSLYLNNLLLIYEDYLDSWKKSDYEYVNAFLNHLNYKEVAALFNMNVSSGWRREKSLKMKQYYTIKEMILSGIE